MNNINKNINKNVPYLVLVLGIIFFITFTYLKVNIRTISVTEQSILNRVNIYRKSQNLGELKFNKILNIAAKNKAIDMKMSNYFSHNSPNNIKWNDFVINNGYHYVVAGENLARGYFTPDELIRDWLSSEKHKENIIFPEFTETGIAILQSDSMGVVIVQLFAKPIDIPTLKL
jgi:uncharacterized protein YkwD